MSNNNVSIYDLQENIIKHYLQNVNVKDDTMVKDYLQKQYLKQVNRKDKNKVKVKGYEYKPHKFLDFTDERKKIWTLDTNTPQYLAFLQFMNTEFKKIYTEYEKNEGEIITAHLVNPEDTESRDILEQYKAKYITNFIDTIDDKDNNHYINKQGKMYPHFMADIMEKNRRLQFEYPEELMDINITRKGIQNHTPLEFLEIIVKRIEGLFTCYKTKIASPEYNYEKSYYFEHELLNEITHLKQRLEIKDEFNDNKTKKKPFMEDAFLHYIKENIKIIKDKIKTIIATNDIDKATVIVKENCKNILWGPKDYKYNQEIKNETIKKKKWGPVGYNFNKDKKNETIKNQKFNEFKTFIENTKDNPNELLFLKTFMIECFKKDVIEGEEVYTNEIDWDSVYRQMGDRTYRQMFFGFGVDINKYKEFKSFYEVLASNNAELVKRNITNCNYLAVYTSFMNFYYNKCSITNTDIDIPVRFILPTNKIKRKPLIIMNNTYHSTHYSSYSYDFRSPSHNINIFANDDIKFIGFINIKVYQDKYNQFRNWTLFVFKNTSKKEFKHYETGEFLNYPIFSHELELINVGSIVARDPTTHEEIKFFQAESEKDVNNVFIYISLLDSKTLFITYKDISDLDYLKDLQLERVLIHDSGRNITHDRKKRFIQIIPYTDKDKILYSRRNNRFRTLGRNNRPSHTGGSGGGHTKIKSIPRTKHKYKATKYKLTKHKLKFTKIVKT